MNQNPQKFEQSTQPAPPRMPSVSRKPISRPGNATSQPPGSRPSSSASSFELASTQSVSPPAYATPVNSPSPHPPPTSPTSSNASLHTSLSRMNSSAAPQAVDMATMPAGRRVSGIISSPTTASRMTSVPQGINIQAQGYSQSQSPSHSQGNLHISDQLDQLTLNAKSQSKDCIHLKLRRGRIMLPLSFVTTASLVS